MVNQILRIGTRESPLAVWQAEQVQKLLRKAGVLSELVYIKSEGDKDFAECSDVFVLINLAVTGCNSVLCLDQESN